MGSARADADVAGLAGNPSVADIDIVIAGGEIVHRRAMSNGRVVSCRCVVTVAHRSPMAVLSAGCVATERRITDGRVVAAGCVVKERIQNRWPCCCCRWCC